MPVDTMVMLELLNEAGDEAVTLDELGVAGVRDPAQALLQLELAGLAIQRVLVRGERAGHDVQCIRLAPPQEEQPTAELAAVAPRPAPEPEPPTAIAPPAQVAHVRGFVLLAVLLALTALLLRRA
jgi:hypothetical protein